MMMLATIYDDLLSRLDATISSLQGGGMGFGTADLIYSKIQEVGLNLQIL